MLARARAESNRLFLGLDASRDALVDSTRRASARPARGGLANAAFVHASLEALPGELAGLADEVTVLFPWGSLLRATAAPDAELLARIRAVCQPGASLRAVFSVAATDQREAERLGIPGTFEPSRFEAAYADAGFEGAKLRLLAAAEVAAIPTAWARRLAAGNPPRTVWEVTARAVGSHRGVARNA